MFKIYQLLRANSIYDIRTKYAEYDRHELNTQTARYSYVIRTQIIRYSYVCYRPWSIARVFKPWEMCIYVVYLNCAYTLWNLHTQYIHYVSVTGKFGRCNFNPLIQALRLSTSVLDVPPGSPCNVIRRPSSRTWFSCDLQSTQYRFPPELKRFLKLTTDCFAGVSILLSETHE